MAENSIFNLTSRNYPLNYPLNLQCVWYLQPPETGQGQLVIRFLDFTLGAYKDHIAVGKGIDASNVTTELTRFTNLWAPLSVTVRDSPAWLIFYSDQSFSAKGFIIQISWSAREGK